MTSQDEPQFAAEFPAATREQWLKLAEQLLNGAPFDQKLVARTYDGLRIEPLYPRRADARPVVGQAAPWRIMQRVEHPDPAAANAEALHELANGATGLTLVFAGSLGSHGYGLDATEATLARALEGVHLDAGISIELDLSTRAKDAGRLLARLVHQRGIVPEATDIRFGFDPIRTLAADGASPLKWTGIAPTFTGIIGDLAGDGFRGPFAVADGRVVHAAGGSEAQELAYALAVAVTYLRTLEAGGVALDDARRMIFFRLAADADQFLTMAKFRAIRKLWARVENACGLAPQPAFVSAATAWRMLTRRDAYVNMLRATVAVFAAALGGADAIAVLPHTAALGLPDRFARRVARNTQLILQEESHLAKVADPAAGSGGVEDLTAKLCAAAWALFQEIEKAGGAWTALEHGLIQQKVAAARAAREAAIAERKDMLTGTSEFPNIHEAPVPVLDLAPIFPALITGEGQGGGVAIPSAQGSGEQIAAAVTTVPLAPMRLAAPFEELRDASDLILAQTGSRPKIFLANLGPIAAFTARAMFAKNFFETGGIEAITNDGFVSIPSPLEGEGGEARGAGRAGRRVVATASSPPPERGRSTAKQSGGGHQLDPSPAPRADPPLAGEGKTDLTALVAAFKASGAALACICSSDQIYAAEALAAARALTAAGARHIYLAGRPGDLETALKAAGVQSFIYAGCNAVATLNAAYDALRA
jgi:methylmalonyl-CoA mutase